jgi:hypothetical protein
MAAIGQLPAAEARRPRILRMTRRIRAPDARRTAVKVAASMSVSRSAARQSSELLAKANMASAARRGTRRPVREAVILRRGIARASPSSECRGASISVD